MNSRQTIGYFLWAGLREGGGVGLLIGTLLLALPGGMIGLAWGSVAGSVLGLLIGLGVAFYNWQFLHYDTDPQTYRRHLVLVVGSIGMIGISLSLLLPASIFAFSTPAPTHSYPLALSLVLRNICLIWSLVALPTLIPSFLAVGATAADYAERHFATLNKRKNEEVREQRPLRSDMSTLKFWEQAIWRRGRWFILAGSLLGIGLISFTAKNPSLSSIGVYWVIGSLVLLVYGYLVLGLLAWLNTFVLQSLNRIYFHEYVPHLTMAHYRRRVMGIAFFVTLIGGLVLTVGIGAIPSAIVAALAARDYAAWRYGEADHKEKRKLAEVSG